MSSRKIKVAACQMQAELGDVSENLYRAERLIEAAFEKGAQWVILPEFFTTAIGFHRSMSDSALPLDGPALKLLVAAARRYHGYVGGSFISIKDGDRYNTFVLARPDGTYDVHNKDIATLWENCYFQGGKDDGIINTDEATVGAVLCWEFLRWQTPNRLKDKIDFVVSGSCWWGYPQLPLIQNLLSRQSRSASQVMLESVGRLAYLLGVPLVHAAQVGSFKGRLPMGGLPYTAFYLGGTQIVDSKGEILASMKREDGAGVITAEIELGAPTPSKPMGDGFWIRKLPWSLSLSWYLFNWHGKRYYRKMKKRGIY